MIVENSGLLTVAALRHLDVKNKRIVSILSGGNFLKYFHCDCSLSRPNSQVIKRMDKRISVLLRELIRILGFFWK